MNAKITTPSSPVQYHVAAVSKNTNSFGYKSVLALNASGLGVQLLVQAYGTDEVPVVGDVVTLGGVPLVWEAPQPSQHPAG